MTSWVFAATWSFPADHLDDVTNGSVRGVSTTSESWGFAKTWYNEDGFGLHAWFHDIADPLADDFYEGWLVQQSPFKFISTGELELKDDGYYHNVFSSDIDYTRYDYYVLTLEPNDGNPAPAAHIFEWDVVMVDMKKEDTMMKKDIAKMKKLTAKQEVLKKWIKQRLARIDSSRLDPVGVLNRIGQVRNTIWDRGFSAEKQARYLEILDVLELVIQEL